MTNNGKNEEIIEDLEEFKRNRTEDGDDHNTGEELIENKEVLDRLEKEYERLKEENKKLKEEMGKKKEEVLRIMADYENLKKRLIKDSDYKIKNAISKFAVSILPVVDHLEMALSHSKESASFESLYEGVELTLKQFRDALKKHGVEDIKVENDEKFDPNFHEAMMIESRDDKENNVITKVLQKGYLMHGNVIRPVKVAVNKKEKQDKEVENGD